MAFPNRAALAVYSGQGFVGTLPLQHMTTRQLSQVARSHPLPMATFYATFGAATEAAIAALAGHNLSTAGQWRLRGYSSEPRPPVDRSTQAAALDLKFSDGTMPPGVACTRSTVATYFDSAGLLQTAAINTPRLHWVAGECQGLLVEPACTNQVFYCRDLSNAYWTKTNMTAALSATGIDGVASSATRLTATAGNAKVVKGSITANWFSVYLRRVSGSGTVQISVNDFAASTTCTLTTSWQRFSMACTVGATVGIRLVTSGDVIEADYLQAETGVGDAPSMPILTAGATVARTADSITYTPAPVISLAAGTLVAQARIWSTLTGSAAQWLRVQDAGTTNAARLTSDLSRNIIGEYLFGGGAQCSLTTGGTPPALGALFTAALSWAAADYRASRSGATAVTDSAGSVSSNAVASILFEPPSQMAFTVARLTLLPAASSSADAQALSTEFTAPAAGYDSGMLDAWPAAWTAGTTAEQRAGVRGLALHRPGTPQTYAWWRVDVTDLTNPAGYVEVGRLFLGGSWQPAVNMTFGAGMGYTDRASVVETDSGAEYFVERPAPRVTKFDLEFQTEADAMGQILEMQRQLGTTGELLWLWDPADTLHAPRRSYLGRLRSLAPVTCIFVEMWTWPVEVKELL